MVDVESDELLEAVDQQVDDKLSEYSHRVADSVLKLGVQGDDFAQWCKTRGSTLEDHVSAVLAAGGVSDANMRMQQVDKASRYQHQLLQERKQRKKDRLTQERMKEAARLSGVKISDVIEFDKSGDKLTSAVMKAVDNFMDQDGASVSDTQQNWREVQSFPTQQEALRFVVGCQPFPYQSVEAAQGIVEPFPKFETGNDAFEYVIKMDPLPSEFVSIPSTFKRRLRIRKVEQQTISEVPRASLRKSRTLGLKSRMAPPEAAPAVKQHKVRWVVESAGQLFERPPSLRGLCDIGNRYYIAVTPEVAKRVLEEGFRVTRRGSIPCSATPQEACAAFMKTQSGQPDILAVNLPPEIDVVAHRESGFLIRAKELPKECFKLHKEKKGQEQSIRNSTSKPGVQMFQQPFQLSLRRPIT